MRLPLIAPLLLASACASGSSGVGTAVRDSAGVEILEHALQPGSLPEWTLELMAEVGGRPDSAPYDLNRAFMARRLRDGTLLVADYSTTELRMFDSTGAWLRTIARAGSGPGEFRYIGTPWQLQDGTLEVPDVTQQRMTRFTSSGDLIGTSALAARQGDEHRTWFAQPVGRLDSTSLLGAIYRMEDTTVALGTPFRATSYLVRMIEGGIADTLLTFPWAESFGEMFTEGAGTYRGYRTVPFGRETSLRVVTGAIWIGTAASHQVDRYSTTGQLTRSIRFPLPKVKVEEEDRDAYRQDQLEQLARWRSASDEVRTQRTRAIAEMPFAETFPPYAAIEASPNGTLWVELSRRPGDEVRRFLIFDPDGMPAARLALPPRTRLMHADDDHIVTRTLDEDDVELIRMYKVLRAEG